MVRLLQGDVGCGKTVVAALPPRVPSAAVCRVQVALMAPTELLAEQHWRNLEQWFRPLGLPVALADGLAAGADAAQRARGSRLR